MPREQKITFGEMRESGVFRIDVFRSDYRCSHSTRLSADPVRLSDVEPHFICKTCGKRGADVRPDYQGSKQRPASQSEQGQLKAAAGLSQRRQYALLSRECPSRLTAA
jgi:hypothetical protein